MGGRSKAGRCKVDEPTSDDEFRLSQAIVPLFSAKKKLHNCSTKYMACCIPCQVGGLLGAKLSLPCQTLPIQLSRLLNAQPSQLTGQSVHHPLWFLLDTLYRSLQGHLRAWPPRSQAVYICPSPNGDDAPPPLQGELIRPSTSTHTCSRRQVAFSPSPLETPYCYLKSDWIAPL